MIQPRLEGLVTEKPEGTLSFWTEDENREMIIVCVCVWLFGKHEANSHIFTQDWVTVFESHLCVCVVYAVIHQDHDEDGDRYAEISNNPAKLNQTNH